MDLVREAVWTEKYRPTNIDGVVGEHKQKIKGFLQNPQSFPNLLLISKEPGTGKTTTAKAIINELDSSYLILNASDDRGIDVIREQIKSFARTLGIEDKRKIIFLDEADNLTKDAQMALRTVMEDYSKNTVFILSCNFDNKIIPPLKNRCVSIFFSKPQKEDVKQHLKNICEKEQLEFDEEGLNKLIEINYPSIRGCINKLQELKLEGKKVSNNNLTSISNMDNIINLIKGKKLQDLVTLIYNNSLNVYEFNTFLWNYLITNDFSSDYPTNMSKKVKLIQLLADNERDFATSADEKIVFASRLVGLMEVFG